MIMTSLAGLGGVVLLGTAVLLSIGGMVQAAETEPQRTIAVVGRGEVTVAPDVAVLSVAVETSAATAGQATAENAAKSGKVIEAIRRELGERDSLKTAGYNLQPRYGERKPGAQTVPQIVGYIASNEVRIRTHRIEAVGAILDAALNAGANRTHGLSFTIEDRNPPARLALAAAGAEARAQAESIAAALGVRLGEVLAASTSASGMPVPPTVRMATMRTEAAAPTPIEAGEETVSAILHVTYAIEN